MTTNLALASITATGATTTRTLGDRWGDVVNVMDFGALGNNSHDDTAAINAAIVAAAAQTGGLSAFRGGVVFFPAGVYITSGPLINNTSQTHVALVGVNSMSSYILGTVTPSPTQSGFTIDQNDGTGLVTSDGLGPTYPGTIDLIENLQVKNTYVATRLWAANAITAATWSNGSGVGLVTFTTTTAHGVTPGEYFSITGVTPAGYNDSYVAQTGTTGSTLIGSISWAAGGANPGAWSSGGTLVAQTVGFDPTAGAIRFNNTLACAIRHCRVDGFNGIVSISNSYNAHFDEIYMSGFANRPGSVGFSVGQCTLTGCTVLGYWFGLLCSTSVGGYVNGFRCESTQSAIVIGAATTDGATNAAGSNFNVVGLQTERCERALVIQGLSTGFFGNLVITGVIGIAHTADFTGSAGTATVTVRTTGSSAPGTLDQLGWITDSTTRQIRVVGGGAYATAGTTWVTATRTSNTTFTYASAGTGATSADWSLQLDTSVTIGSVLAKFITIAGCNVSTLSANLSGVHYKLASLANANTLISCQGPAGATLWQMPPAAYKASYQYINCNQPGGTTTDGAGNQSGMNFADLPGQSGVQQSGPVEGQEYDIVNSNTATWGATAAAGGSNHVKVRYNGSNWTVVGA